jgi:lipid-A-disaccharide synthase
MDCDFVGHPVVAEPVASDAQAAAMGAGTVVLVLPGSRKGEVSRLADRFGEAAKAIAAAIPDAMFVIPTTGGVHDLVKERVAHWAVPVTVLPPGTPDKAAWFKRADVALAASGTVSLELAASGTPMVIAYDMAWLSRIIISRMLMVDTVTLVNLVSETRVVPEFIGQNCEPAPIAQAVLDVLANPDAQRAAMDLTMQRLGQGGDAPGLRAARAVLDRLDQTAIKDNQPKGQ